MRAYCFPTCSIRVSKKLTRKEKIAQQQQSAQPSKRQQAAELQQQQRSRNWAGLIVAIVAFLVYANTFQHGWALDDWGVIPDNKLTKRGISAIPEIMSTTYRTGMDVSDHTLYRPLSKATFAIEWSISPDNPSLGHIDNVILYALTCFLLFRVLLLCFPRSLFIPFAIALLYAVHPLHTEVIANVKSRDEILSMLFFLLTLRSALLYARGGKWQHLPILALSFFAALLSKESAITYLAAVPLALYFFSEAKGSHYRGVMVSMAVPAVLFLLIRASILGQYQSAPYAMVDNHLIGIKDFVTQRTSAIYLLGVYLYKHFIPHPLICDGSYAAFDPAGPGDWKFILSFLIHIGALVYAIMNFKKRDPIAFGILFYFVTISIISNVLMLIGTNYAERLLFVPSLGWCIVVAVLLDRLAGWLSPQSGTTPVPLVLTALVVLGFSSLTLARNQDWHDETRLFNTDLKKVPRSAHMRFYVGNHISAEDYLTTLPDSAAIKAALVESIAQLDTAISIWEPYGDAWQRRAYNKYVLNNYPAAEQDFIRALEINPTNPVAHNNYGNLLFNTRRYDLALQHFEQAVKYNPRYSHAWNNLASVYGVYGEGAREQAMNNPAERDRYMADARQKWETAIGFFKKAIEQEADYAVPYRMLGFTYRNLGDEAMANKYFREADEIAKKKANAKN